MAARTFTANFVGRTSNLEKSFKRVAKGSELMSNKLMRATRMAGIGFTAFAGVAIGADGWAGRVAPAIEGGQVVHLCQGWVLALRWEAGQNSFRRLLANWVCQALEGRQGCNDMARCHCFRFEVCCV